jgi:hypothetical protein
MNTKGCLLKFSPIIKIMIAPIILGLSISLYWFGDSEYNSIKSIILGYFKIIKKGSVYRWFHGFRR